MSTSKADFYFVTDERCRNTVKSYFSDLQEEHVVHISGCVYFSLKILCTYRYSYNNRIKRSIYISGRISEILRSDKRLKRLRKNIRY